jgi:predicted ribosome quality control (RQC) complex YloA/Tae2 family protein
MQEFMFNNEIYYICIGKNADNNWYLLDNSLPKYVLFHVYPGSSSYVILKNETFNKLRDIPLQIIKRCSCLCKNNSSSKKEKKVEVHYTFVEYCEKGQRIGEVKMNGCRAVKV